MAGRTGGDRTGGFVGGNVICPFLAGDEQLNCGRQARSRDYGDQTDTRKTIVFHIVCIMFGNFQQTAPDSRRANQPQGIWGNFRVKVIEKPKARLLRKHEIVKRLLMTRHSAKILPGRRANQFDSERKRCEICSYTLC